ncbi:MAG TPA: phosphoribosylaminoimidazolesuccinocarboxamide synthase [Deltaproteobacteria bacterium]|nr:MAG: phosphoribosylaminoimidazolesuccinocarboxamide synthase [Deltaproteobacteria bacterium GWA2_55_82]OGQ64002.1 MAG: phosphoribosylaminoimidazolesuccinocarboxamide synthase [Deltaproteobacteria bacterium RIFCSPLOWO2_02_FULL_55_12]OIJ73435.1 MAG: phosphoribosylaminoimidazolesuccinocarboxamide synthase [Deltaproteobacteria bacterium GWC2_55_46]HBG47298.1 phosphoribosylaminoimidazolesuccinocarboxamide synthase [Deltaproteobacteria bacterium]HCY10064.1 phosphoribosylaminoimidazolesuccinocarbox
MEKRDKIYEGKAKVLYTTDNPDLLIQYFKDEATAFDGKKKGIIEKKGIFNNKISSAIFRLIESNGIKTHFVDQPSDREMVVKKLRIIPVEVVVRNLVAGSLAKRLGMEEGAPLKEPIVEFFYKSDPLGDPMINEYHARAFGFATDKELKRMSELALRINEILSEFFDKRGIILVDFKLEFGEHNGEVLLGDEITPDGCRLWDKVTREKMDKDRFRRDLGKVEEAYQEVLRKVTEKI